MTLRKVLFLVLTAACYVLQAAFILWFWPNILWEMATGNWQRQRVKIRRINRAYERLGFEEWFRKENETRRKRVWKNSKNFYKT